MADGYGVGLFDSSGPQKFADTIKKISDALTGVQGTFGTFGTQASSSISGIASAIDKLVGKLTGLQQQVQQTRGAMGQGGGGGSSARGMGQPAPPIPGGGTNMLSPQNWTPRPNPGPMQMQGNPMSGMPQSTASGGPSSFPNAALGTAAAARAAIGPSMVGGGTPPFVPPSPGGGGWGGPPNWPGPPGGGPPGGPPGAPPGGPPALPPGGGPPGGPPGPSGGGGWGGRAAVSLPPAVGSAAAGFIAGASGLMQTAVQGATIGQMLAPASGMNPKSMYVIPNNAMVMGPGDYAQANYYAAMMAGVAPSKAPGSNWSTMQRGANQLMTLLPNTSRQEAMQTQNQLQAPGVLNAAQQVGLNLRPGGRMQDPQSQFSQIFNRLFLGKTPDINTFYAVMAPGGNGEVNLASIGIQPGSDAYLAFMQYGITRVNADKQGKKLGDLGTPKGAKAAGLDTPAYAALQAESKKSQLISKAEPTMADAAKTLNEAATKLLSLAQGGVSGGIGGALSKVIPGFGIGESLLGHIPVVGGVAKSLLSAGGIGKLLSGGVFPGVGLGKSLLHFQEGGEVPGKGEQMAVVHGGEYVLNKDQVNAMLGMSPAHKTQTGGKGKGALDGGEYVLTKEQVQKMLSTRDGKTQTGHKGGGAFDPESPLGMLLGKVTDIPNTALNALLSPAPQGSLVAALGGGGAQKTQQGGKPVGGGAPGGAPIALAPLLAGQGKKGGGGILGDLANSFGGGGGGVGQPTGGGGGGKAATPYKWDYGATSVLAADYSGMFMTQSGKSADSSNAASGSGGTGASGSASKGAGSKGGAPTGTLAQWIAKAMQLTGVSGSDWTNGLNLIIQHESGGNPKAINNWDSNAAAGHPSQGLMQEIPSTFQSNALPGYDKDITDPVSNVAAGIRYIQSRYKGINNVPGVKQVASGGSYVGYARGSQRIDRTQLALLHAGEAVVPAQDNYSSAPYNRGGQMGGGGSVLVHLDFRPGSIVLQVPATSNQTDMEQMAQKFVQAISKPQLLDAVRNT